MNMANKEQIKALIDSFFDHDNERFITVAMQVAASAAKKGNSDLARELKDLIDRGRDRAKKDEKKVLNFNKLHQDLSSLLSVKYPSIHLTDVVFSDDVDSVIRKVIKEQMQRFRLKEYRLNPTSKLLLVGPSGTGKTLTANILASELKIPLYTVQFEGLLSKYMGESAAKLKLIFDQISNERAVYLFDEFDAIGAKRDKENDVGEIRRVLNSFLQFLESQQSDSIIVAATNHPDMLDAALFRRFDIVCNYSNPDIAVIETLLKESLFSFAKNSINWKKLAEKAEGMNHAEIVKACNEIAKEIILNEKFFVTVESLAPFFKR